MTKQSSSPDDDQEITTVIDAYGIKIPVKTRRESLGEPAPSSWSEVSQQVRQHLMRIAAAPTRLVAEILEGATRLVRGLGQIPGALASRLDHAHDQADQREGQRQQRAELRNRLSADENRSNSEEVDSAEHATSQIERILQKYSAQGFDAYVTLTPDGQIVIVLGTPPGSEDHVREMVEKTQRLLTAESETLEPDH